MTHQPNSDPPHEHGKHSWETTCDHGECFGGKCIYAKATDAGEGPATVWMERRLRNAALNADNPVNYLCSQAADTIESLRRQVAELKEPACPDCKNTFKQPFICITCGAQKLYDTTLQTAQKRAEKAEAENAALREDAERYRWFRLKRLWDADSFPWPKDFEYPEPCLWDDGEMLDAAIDAVRKK